LPPAQQVTRPLTNRGSVPKTIAPLAVVLALVLAACSERRDDRDGQEDAPPAASVPLSSSAAATTTSSGVDSMRDVCQIVDVEASRQLVAEAMAIGGNEKGPVLRAGVAATYSDFADRLSQVALEAPGNLRSALTEWASASTEVARFVAGSNPGPGLVVDYGPAQPRWNAARKAAENICGHRLPNR
jgi:hypothetical protein